MPPYHMIDIEDMASLKAYLKEKNILKNGEKSTMEILKGGVSNKAVLWIREDGTDWVIKQGLGQLRVDKEWYCDPKRLKIEYLGMIWLSKVMAKGVVPNPYFWDEDNFVLGMQAIPRPHDNLKELLLRGEVDLSLIAQMGANLASIHSAGKNSKEAQEVFHDRSFFKSLRVEPYYINASNELKGTTGFFNELIEETLKIQQTVVHGDYSPKNMLVRKGRIILLDHEVMHYGDPAFDIGFALCHLLSKANHLFRLKKKFIQAAQTFWKYYTKNPTVEVTEQNEARAVKHIMACLIARVKGKSPLEYLNVEEKERQLDITLGLIPRKIEKVPEFIDAFSEKLKKQ